MKNRFLMMLASVLFALGVCATLNHSPEDTYRYVRSRLGWQVNYGRMVLRAAFDGTDVAEPAPEGWEGFLGTKMSNGWTFEERKEAFDWYLANLATNDCRSLSLHEQFLVYVALEQCEDLCYTNSYMAARGLVLNPNGVHRDKALEVMAKFGPLNDEMTQFIESIATNTTAYTWFERGTSLFEYEKRLCGSAVTNAATANAVQMFRRLKHFDAFSAVPCDMVFCQRIEGWTMSSNRLEYALWALGNANLQSNWARRFTSVTNQLLSSGQPLVQLNIGGGD